MYPAMASSIKVFSAHAEVVPGKNFSNKEANSILRARGGSSDVMLVAVFHNLYSPRTRR